MYVAVRIMANVHVRKLRRQHVDPHEAYAFDIRLSATLTFELMTFTIFTRALTMYLVSCDLDLLTPKLII